MTIKFYELAGADAALRFSPHCWRTRMALLHKGVEFEGIAWRFLEKDAIAFSGQGAVPLIVDGETCVTDSWAIAEYLDATYPDRPSLFGGESGRALTRFYNNWANGVLLPKLVGCIIKDVHDCLHEGDKAYFRETREARFGRPLEEVVENFDENLQAFRQSLGPLRATLKEQPYLGGASPLYADYSVFGVLQWARCTSSHNILESDDPLHAWRDRLLDRFDGHARKAVALERAAA